MSQQKFFLEPSTLPPDIYTGHLPFKDLLKLCSTNKAFRQFLLSVIFNDKKAPFITYQKSFILSWFVNITKIEFNDTYKRYLSLFLRNCPYDEFYFPCASILYTHCSTNDHEERLEIFKKLEPYTKIKHSISPYHWYEVLTDSKALTSPQEKINEVIVKFLEFLNEGDYTGNEKEFFSDFIRSWLFTLLPSSISEAMKNCVFIKTFNQFFLDRKEVTSGTAGIIVRGIECIFYRIFSDYISLLSPEDRIKTTILFYSQWQWTTSLRCDFETIIEKNCKKLPDNSIQEISKIIHSQPDLAIQNILNIFKRFSSDKLNDTYSAFQLPDRFNKNMGRFKDEQAIKAYSNWLNKVLNGSVDPLIDTFVNLIHRSEQVNGPLALGSYLEIIINHREFDVEIHSKKILESLPKNFSAVPYLKILMTETSHKKLIKESFRLLSEQFFANKDYDRFLVIISFLKNNIFTTCAHDYLLNEHFILGYFELYFCAEFKHQQEDSLEDLGLSLDNVEKMSCRFMSKLSVENKTNLFQRWLTENKYEPYQFMTLLIARLSVEIPEALLEEMKIFLLEQLKVSAPNKVHEYCAKAFEALAPLFAKNRVQSIPNLMEELTLRLSQRYEKEKHKKDDEICWIYENTVDALKALSLYVTDGDLFLKIAQELPLPVYEQGKVLQYDDLLHTDVHRIGVFWYDFMEYFGEKFPEKLKAFSEQLGKEEAWKIRFTYLNCYKKQQVLKILNESLEQDVPKVEGSKYMKL